LRNALKGAFPTQFFDVISVLLNNRLLKFLDAFFGAIARVLKPFTNLMNRRINIRVPIPGIRHKRVCITIPYPCGVKWCHKYVGLTQQKSKVRGWARLPRIRIPRVKVRYPCGAHICRRRTCSNIPYPTITMKRFGFTVAQIIRGVLNVLKIVMDLLMAALKKMIPGLPSLSFNIPGLNLPRFAISFPRFNLKLPSLKMPGFNLRLPSFKFSRCSAVATVANKLNKALGGKSHSNSYRRPNNRRKKKPNRRRRRSRSNQCTRKRDTRRYARECHKWKNKHCKSHKWVQKMCKKTCCLHNRHNRRPVLRRVRRRPQNRCARKKDTRRWARKCHGWKNKHCRSHKWVQKMCKKTCCLHNRKRG